MNITEEREQYVKKLDAQISGMTALLDPKFQDIISDAKADEIRKLLNKAKSLRQKFANNEFEIAIIGLEKAGKSTFANALMGNDILPSMDARCTYTATSIRYGAGDYAEVVFFSREEFSKKFVDNLKVMGIEHAENYDYETLSLSKYRTLFDQLPEEKKNYYRASVNEDVENVLEHRDTLSANIGASIKVYKGSEQLESYEFKKYIQDPAFAVAVKTITIHSSKLINMQNAVLYDVPGFDSPTQIHKEQTIHMMATADVIILIANAGKPSITGPQVQIFEGEVDQDGIPFNEKIFVFGNKADTANDAIDANIRVLKNQLERYRIVRPELIERRVVIGSARAKLEKDGKLPDTGLCTTLQAKGIGNGIEEIADSLERYNNTERFEVLKKRINRIYTELEECLSSELTEDFGDNGFNIGEISSIVVTLLNNAQTKIKADLQSLHSEVPKEFAQSPLSKKFFDRILSINSETYAISEEEKTAAINVSGTTGANISLDEFERILRKIKYDQIYNYFIATIIDIAIETHEEYDGKIKDIFLQALSITTDNPYYEELVNSVVGYLSGINPESREGYYRSLAERFTTDLFETLIRQNFGGRDRWAAFEDRKLNLYSLSIFHSENISDLPADRQPMLYSILFHDQEERLSEADQIEELLAIIQSFVPDSDVDAEKFAPLLKKVLAEEQIDANPYLQDVCERRPHTTSERFLYSLYNYLDEEFEDTEPYEPTERANCSFPVITQTYYKERCKSEELNSNDSEVVCKHIHSDIDILGDILLKAAIPAIQMDKAFVYYAVRSIENILSSIEPGEAYQFGDFVVKNTAKIAYGQLADVEAEEKKRQLRREICSEIKKILGSVRSYNEE